MSDANPTSSDPRLDDARPGLFGRVINRFLKYKGLLQQLGALSIIIAGAQYFFTYGDRVEERQNKDVEVIRQIQVLYMDGSKKDATKGFLGVAEPLQRLTRDCGKRTWWRWPFWYFERDCVPLKSLKLEHADLGDIVLRSANLSQGSFHCSNLRGADFANANLAFKWLGGANLAYADFSGAKFKDADNQFQRNQFWFAELTGAVFSEDTDIDPEALRCGCLSGGESIKIQEIPGKTSRFAQVKEDLKKQRCVENVCGTLFVEPGNDQEKAKRHNLPDACAARG